MNWKTKRGKKRTYQTNLQISKINSKVSGRQLKELNEIKKRQHFNNCKRDIIKQGREIL